MERWHGSRRDLLQRSGLLLAAPLIGACSFGEDSTQESSVVPPAQATEYVSTFDKQIAALSPESQSLYSIREADAKRIESEWFQPNFESWLKLQPADVSDESDFSSWAILRDTSTFKHLSYEPFGHLNMGYDIQTHEFSYFKMYGNVRRALDTVAQKQGIGQDTIGLEESAIVLPAVGNELFILPDAIDWSPVYLNEYYTPQAVVELPTIHGRFEQDNKLVNVRLSLKTFNLDVTGYKE